MYAPHIAIVAAGLWLMTVEASGQETPQGPVLVAEITNGHDEMINPYGVAIDSEGSLYVTDAGRHRVLVFAARGAVARWDSRGSGPGQFHSLGFGGIAIDSEDHVFVVDNGNHRIQKFTKEGAFLLEWGTKGTGPGQFMRAIGIATDAEGQVYVTDDENPFVQKFDNQGRFLTRFGGPGSGEGRFRHPTGIAVAQDGSVYVSDYETRLVQKFTPKGEFVLSWKLGADLELTGTPEGMAFDEVGNLYISDYSLGRVQVFDTDGRHLWSLGAKTLVNPLFLKPTSLAFGAGRHLFVVNQAGRKVSVYRIP